MINLFTLTGLSRLEEHHALICMTSRTAILTCYFILLVLRRRLVLGKGKVPKVSPLTGDGARIQNQVPLMLLATCESRPEMF